MAFVAGTFSLQAETAPLDPNLGIALREYADKIQADLGTAMNPRSGGGTGFFMNEVNRTALQMKGDPRLQAPGLNLAAELRKLFSGPQGEPQVREFDIPMGYAKYLNERLAVAGMEFVQVRPTDKSRLLELFYQLGSVGFESVDLAELKALSAKANLGVDANTIKVPVADDRLVQEARKKLEIHPKRAIFKDLRLIRDETVTDESQVVLPNPESPLAHEASAYKLVANIRSAIAIPLAAVGTLVGGNFTLGSYVAAASPVGQELNFIFTSTKWNGFWKKFGLKGNFAINAHFGALVTSFAILGAVATSGIGNSVGQIGATVGLAVASFVGSYYALELVKYRPSLKTIAGLIGGMAALAFFGGGAIDLNLAEFFLKGLGLNTLAFFATFGGAQIAGGKLHERGELSEGRRFPYLESTLNIFAGTARGLALGAMASGLGKTWFNINDITGPVEVFGVNWANIGFNKTEIFSWVAQLAVGLVVTVPFALRSWIGNQAVDSQTAEILTGEKKSGVGPASWIGAICGAPLRALARAYTPSRTRKPVKS